MNRIEPILDILNGETMDQEQQMMYIMEALSDTVTPIPDVGTLCTFVYNARLLTSDMISTHWWQSLIYLLGDFVEQTFIIEKQDNTLGEK